MRPKRKTQANSDVLVTLTADQTDSLEDRLDAMYGAFVRILRGSELRRVLKWDMTAGSVEFIIGGATCDARRLNGWPVTATMEQLGELV